MHWLCRLLGHHPVVIWDYAFCARCHKVWTHT